VVSLHIFTNDVLKTKRGREKTKEEVRRVQPPARRSGGKKSKICCGLRERDDVRGHRLREVLRVLTDACVRPGEENVHHLLSWLLVICRSIESFFFFLL